MTEISKPLSNSSLFKPDAILFDWDGTLIDSLPALHSYYNHVLSAYNLPLLTLDEAKKRIRKSARDVFPEIFGDKAEEALDLYFAHARKTHLDHVREIDGADTFLRRLQTYVRPLAVVSNKRNEFLQREVTLMGWNGLVHPVVGAGVAARDKPAPDALMLAMNRMNVNPDTHHVWYVGDTETDMQAAYAAGCQPIFIEHGLGTRADCVGVGVEPYFVADFAEILRLVENLRVNK